MMNNFLKNNGLSLILFSLFFVSLLFMSISGLYNYNNEQAEHGQPPVTYTEYIISGSFVEALSENMESEFLQMFFYIILTAMFYQKGSAESKKIDEPEEVDRDPLANIKPDSPLPVKKGGFLLKIYEHSLSIAFFLLFLISFIFHAAGGVKEYNQDQLSHGGHAISFIEYFFTSRFWFESFQNWQSEFFSIGIMVVFSIFLRQRGSPESKPVDAPHSETGK
jgi:preprotein translocase subunit SecG